MAKQPKDHVKKHLRRNGVNPNDLSDDTIEALNAFTDAELQKVDRLGTALQDAQRPDANTKISAVH